MLYLPGLKMILSIFCPAHTPPTELSGTVSIMTVTDSVDFKAMATEQNHCEESQRLLSGSSLKIVFWEVGAQRLVGDFSTGIFRPVVPEKFRKDLFLKLAQYFTPREARLPAYDFF
jgi:hypothetical protein